VNDIETRCRELNHAILVLGQLDSWVDIKNGGESAQALARFYAYLRAKMMEAMGTKSARLLEAQIAMILHVRSAWHNLDTQQLPVPEKLTEALSGVAGSAYQSMQDGIAERVRFSQTA